MTSLIGDSPNILHSGRAQRFDPSHTRGMQGLATSARHAFAATATNQHWRTPYVHVPMCGGNKGACGAALARGQGGAAALPLSPYYP